MSVLLLRLTGPMQAWGTRSRFQYRDTEREPTLSGVVGLLAAAEGLPRSGDLGRYLSLHMTVRADREGVLCREFQTAQNVLTADGKVSPQAQIVYRDYLADAAFHVAVAGPSDLLQAALGALHRPRYPLFLGRRSCVPSVPVVYPGEESLVRDTDDPLDVLRRLVIEGRTSSPQLHRMSFTEEGPSRSVRFVVQAPEETSETRRDRPIDFSVHDRRYGTRNVKTVYLEVPVRETKEATG